MTYSPNKSDENDGDDDNNAAPTPTTDWDNDDDEPPAAGAVMVEIEDNHELKNSLAPTAEEEHRAEPEAIPAL